MNLRNNLELVTNVKNKNFKSIFNSINKTIRHCIPTKNPIWHVVVQYLEIGIK